MTLFHFYDIECLNNIFTLTVYWPEKNLVEQYYLADAALANKLSDESALLNKLRQRVNLRNPNFTPQRQMAKKGNGKVELLDLSLPKNSLRLAQEFGLSDAQNVNDPTDDSFYPAYLRPICDTDQDTPDGRWQPDKVQARYQAKLPKISQLATPEQMAMTKPNYHIYDPNQDPYLLGYNSDNYDLTLLAIFMQETFMHKDEAPFDAYAISASGARGFAIVPPSPRRLRLINNKIFSSEYVNNMPSILYHPPYMSKNAKHPANFSRAFQIRKNWLATGRHLDVSRLNEHMHRVGLKRLLGMLGYQILESNKLSNGQDMINNLEQFYDLLAYNASDCINLAALFFDDKHNTNGYYLGQFNLKRNMLKQYPMIIYQKQANAYAPSIAPDHVKPNRMRIDSSSAQIATNVVCPYGTLADIPAVSFTYPEKRKAKETGIPQFNVLKQTEKFFMDNVYTPALKTNSKAAKSALHQFARIMRFYRFIEGKNFNDSSIYFAQQLKPYNPDLNFSAYSSQDFLNMLNSLNPFDLITNQHKNTTIGFIKGFQLAVPMTLIRHCRTFYQRTSPILKISDFITWLKNKNDNYVGKDGQEFIQRTQTEMRLNPNDSNSKLYQQDQAAYEKYAAYFTTYAKQRFNANLKLESYSRNLYHNWQDARIAFNNRPLRHIIVRPYRASDLPADNYCLPFFKKDASPSAGYALFSIGGIHGAEYNQKLYQQDKHNAQIKQELMLNDEKNSSDNSHESSLFKKQPNGLYELNKRYGFTSVGQVIHEDFSSYYPSMCRMLNVYWNPGIGRDIYGGIYDRKQKLGKMMVDPKYTPEQRAYYRILRQGTKLILNSTTGKGDSHGQNSPIQMNNNIISMRVIGQMFTWRIGQAQTLAGAKAVSTNTDGLYIETKDAALSDRILAEQVKQIHVQIDPEPLFLISKDANNRIEENAKTLAIQTPSGGSLAAFTGPQPTKALAHPAAIDRALGLYLQQISQSDPLLMKPFDDALGMKLIKNLGLSKNKDETELQFKQRKLLFYQNILASSPGSRRYIFAGNAATANKNPNADKIDESAYHIVQQYSRVFYVKAGAKTEHIFVAAGRKVPTKTQYSRRAKGEKTFNNTPLAVKILVANGIDVHKLNQLGNEARVVKLPSLPSAWSVVFVNQALASLSEQQTDKLLQDLDYDKYLSLLKDAYINNWCNNLDYRKAYKKDKNQQKKTKSKQVQQLSLF